MTRTAGPGPGLDPPSSDEAVLDAQPDSVGEARRRVRAFAEAHGVRRETLDVILLCVSEAATNAVVHAFVGREPGHVTVRMAAEPDLLRVTVTDDGAGMRPRPDSPGLGLGLPTMGQLADQLEIREGPEGRGTEVRMAFHAPGVRGLEPAAVESGRYELLAELARVAESAGWPDIGVDRLVELLVPLVADACAIDVVDDDGVPRRLAGRIAGGGPGESRWLAELNPRFRAEGSATQASLAQRRPRQAELTPEHIANITHSAEDARRMAATGIRWWLVVPLLEHGHLLGLLHFGRREARGRFGDETVEFLATVGERASRGLATTQLAGELQRTRTRLEAILNALGEAITVQDAAGRIVYANDAAARLMGLGSVREILDAAPGMLLARFTVTREDGTPVAPEELPGRRVLDGLSGDPLVTRSVSRATGAERLIRTRAVRLDDELALNILEDLTDGPPRTG